MKKILIILWTIIIVGFIFIGYSVLSPKTADTPDSSSRISRKTNPIDISTISIEKNYGEYIELGDKYFKEENYALALKNYKSASQLSENFNILMKLGESYLRDNQYEKAKETFSKAQKTEPDSVPAKLGEIKSLLGQKNIESAKTILWTLDPSTPEVKYYRGVTLLLYKSFDEARKTFEELIAQTEPAISQVIIDNSQKFIDKYRLFDTFKESDHLFLQTLLAKALTEVNENPAAIPLLYDVLNQQNNYRDAWIVLGYAYLKTGQSADAIDALLRAKDLDPDKSETLFYLGLAYFSNNEEDKAIQYLKAAEEKGYPEKDLITLKLAELYLLENKFRTSEKYYEEVITLNPSDINAFIKAVWLNIDKIGNPAKAVELASKANQLFPENPMSYNLKGWALTANGEYEEARTFLTRALEMDKEFDAAHLNLGWLYEKQNLKVLAQEYYKKAYTLGKGNSISIAAAEKFNKLTQEETNPYYKVDISSP